MWSVPEGTDEDDKNNTNVEFEEDFEDNFASSLGQEVESIVSAFRCSRFDELWEQLLKEIIDSINRSGAHEEESQVKVRQTCPGKDQLHRVINELEL